MTKRDDLVATGFREMADELDEQRALLEQIKGLLVTLADGQSEHRSATRDAVDRLGTRVLNTEQRVAALERVVPGAAE